MYREPILDWSAQGACVDQDPELFFPISDHGPGHAQMARAKAICAHCPVRTPCLDYALETGQPHGVWGGADPLERRAFVLQRAG